MDDALMEFLDRHDAGCRLAQQLEPLAGEHPIVIALPRGGVPVAFEVARALGAPLDVLAVRKLGAPGSPEFGVGAIAEDGTAVLASDTARRVGMTKEVLRATVEREVRELRQRVERYRDGRVPLDVRGRTVIVVDEGLATGLTDLAAVRALCARGAGRIVVAVPIGARESVTLVGEEADEVVCHTIPQGWLHTASFDGQGGHSVQSPPVIAASSGGFVAGGIGGRCDGGQLDLLLRALSAPSGLPIAGFSQPASCGCGGNRQASAAAGPCTQEVR
jgi:predicted phosphoribosyltransferase